VTHKSSGGCVEFPSVEKKIGAGESPLNPWAATPFEKREVGKPMAKDTWRGNRW